MGSIRWGCLGWPRARPPPARPPAASGEGQCWGAHAKLPLLQRSPMLLWVTPKGLEEWCLTDPIVRRSLLYARLGPVDKWETNKVRHLALLKGTRVYRAEWDSG